MLGLFLKIKNKDFEFSTLKNLDKIDVIEEINFSTYKNVDNLWKTFPHVEICGKCEKSFHKIKEFSTLFFFHFIEYFLGFSQPKSLVFDLNVDIESTKHYRNP